MKQYKTMINKLFITMLCVAMLAAVLPVSVFADDGSPSGSTIPLSDYITTVKIERRSDDAHEWKELSAGGKAAEGDQLRIQIFYELPENTLTEDHNRLSYQITGDIKVLEKSAGAIPGEDDENGGEYEINTDGEVIITVNDKYVKKNISGSKLDGYVTFYSSVTSTGKKEGEDIVFPYKEGIVIHVENPDGDLSVDKTSLNVKHHEGTLDYQITVSSKEGTADRVVLVDTMENAVAAGEISIKDRNNQTVSYEGVFPNITLPKMNKGDQYIITYSAKLDDDHPLTSNNYQTVKNSVAVSSKDTWDEPLNDQDEQEDLFSRPVLSKKGFFNLSDNTIDWIVEISNVSINRNSLSGWTLSDWFNGSVINPEIEVTISPNPETGIGTITTHFPYKFPEKTVPSDYKVTYRTSGSSDSINRAILTPPYGGEGISAETVPQILNVTKKAAGVYPVGNDSEDNVIVKEEWQLKIDANSGTFHANIIKPAAGINPIEHPEAFPNGGYWSVSDSLYKGQTVFITEELRNENLNNIINGIKESGYSGHYYIFCGSGDLNATHSLIYRSEGSSDVWDYTKGRELPEIPTVTVLFDSDFGPGKEMNILYANYFNVGSGTVGMAGTNSLVVKDADNVFQSTPIQWYVPAVNKRDSRNMAGGQITEHDYDDLFYRFSEDYPEFDAYTLEWSVNINIPRVEYSEPLVICEELPEGTQLYLTGKNGDLSTPLSVKIEDENTAVRFFSGWFLGIKNHPGTSSVGYEGQAISYADDNYVGYAEFTKDSVTTRIDYRYDPDNRTLEFTIPAELANLCQGGVISFQIYASIEETSWDGIYKAFTNNVSLKTGSTLLGQAEQTQKVRHKLISKASDGVKDGNVLPYSIRINPSSADLVPHSDKLTLTDEMSYTVPEGTVMNANLKNVTVYRIAKDEEGKEIRTDITSSVSYTVKDETVDGKNRYTAVFTIPDSTALEIDYEYHFSGKGHLKDVVNIASVRGSGEDRTDDEHKMDIIIQDADSGIVAVGINVYKVDSENYSVHLGGAKFTLKKWTADGWVNVPGPDGDSLTYTTSESEGMFNTGELEKNTAYRLTETEAPAGYEFRTADVYDFYISDPAHNSGMIAVMPPESENYTVKALNDGDSMYIENEKIKVGDLSVKKTVSGNAADLEKTFEFTVTLSDTGINGTYGEMEFTDGVAKISLKHNETKTAKNLPENIEYTVEEKDYSEEGYHIVSKINDKGTIKKDTAMSAVFTNERNATGKLSVEKILKGNSIDKEKTFHFTVKLDDTSFNATAGDVTFVNGVASFDLKGGEKKIIDGLPNGTGYTVSESDYTGEGYQLIGKTGDTGTISETVVSEAVFTNERNETGDLSVRKTVEGKLGSKSRSFEFTVTLSDTGINGTYGEMKFTDGVAKFSLKHGETKTALGLPSDIEYSVEEKDYSKDGYITSKTNDKGRIQKGILLKAVFVNRIPSYTPPGTGVK